MSDRRPSFDNDYDSSEEDEDGWVETAGQACQLRADGQSWGPTTVMGPDGSLVHEAGNWLQSSLLDWMLHTTNAADAARAYGMHAPPRRPRGLIRTACADAPPLTPAAPRPRLPVAPLAPPNARMHRIQESFVKVDGAICRMRPGTVHEAGWAPRGGGTIEDACGGRWFSRLSRSLLVGRKPLSARELAELKAEGVSSVLSVIEAHEFAVAPSSVRKEGFQHLVIPVREGTPLTLEQLWQGITFMRSAGEKGGGGEGGMERGRERRSGIYVHCRRGRVRCVMMCTAFVMVTSELDLRGAEGQVIKAHPFGKLRKAHRQVLHTLCQYQRGALATPAPDYPVQHGGGGVGWEVAEVRSAVDRDPAQGGERERGPEGVGLKVPLHTVRPAKVPDCLTYHHSR